MKKIVTAIAFVLLCSGAYAQFNQGRILAGGSVGFQSQTVKREVNGASNTAGKYNQINFNPKVGYFVIDNLAVGLGVDLASATFKAEGSNNKNTQSAFTVTPFVRYYLDMGLFFQGQVGFGNQKDKTVADNTTTTTKNNVLDWALGVGYAYFLNDHVAIEPIVYYGSHAEKRDNPDVKDTYAGLGINVGLQVYLGARN